MGQGLLACKDMQCKIKLGQVQDVMRKEGCKSLMGILYGSIASSYRRIGKFCRVSELYACRTGKSKPMYMP